MPSRPTKRIGVLALQGDVSEHVAATKQALRRLKLTGRVSEVRDQASAQALDALIIPGGESTVLHTLASRAGIFEQLKKIPYIFGTCAGTIFLSKNIKHKAPGQQTLELLDIAVDRNAYGAQTESFETDLTTTLGKITAIFIRAPRITAVGKDVKIVAKLGEEIVGVEQMINGCYYLATCFHPELTTTIFHEHFLKQIYKR